MRRLLAVLIVLASYAAPVSAQDKSAAPPELPPPKPLTPPPVVVEPGSVVFVPSVPYRVSRYQVWQNLAVDSSGRFRPRVITTTYGAYYYYNGMPYPTPSIRSWYYSPDITGSGN